MRGLHKMNAVFGKDSADMATMETIVTENQAFFQQDTISEAIKRNSMEMEDGATVYIQDLVIVAYKDTGKISCLSGRFKDEPNTESIFVVVSRDYETGKVLGLAEPGYDELTSPRLKQVINRNIQIFNELCK